MKTKAAPMDEKRSPNREALQWLVTSFLVIGSVLQIGMGVLFTCASGLVAPFWMGTFTAQCSLIAIGSVLLPETSIRRMLYTVVSIGAMLLAFYFGICIGTKGKLLLRAGSDFPLLHPLPLLFAGAQVGPWIVRSWFNWRIHHPAYLPEPRGLSIGGLMGTTAYVAVVFAVARLDPHKTPGEFAGNAALLMGVSFVINLVVTLCALPIFLGKNPSRIVTAYVFLFFGFLWGGLLGWLFQISFEVLFGIGGFLIGFVGVMGSFLKLARRLGFLLETAEPR